MPDTRILIMSRTFSPEEIRTAQEVLSHLEAACCYDKECAELPGEEVRNFLGEFAVNTTRRLLNHFVPSELEETDL